MKQLESYEVVKLHRSQIQLSDYNPRKITPDAKKKLKKNIKENGLIQPIIVNKRTMHVVGGHQRLTVADELMNGKDYEINCALIDVDEKKEVSLNVFLNNASAQGEWDTFALQDLHTLFPDIDYEADFGFDESEIDIMLGDMFKAEEPEPSLADPMKEAKKQLSSEDFREMKKEQREKAKADNGEGKSYNLDESDYVVQIVFPNNREKADFMRKIKKDPKEKFVKSSVLYDIQEGVYDLSVFNQ